MLLAREMVSYMKEMWVWVGAQTKPETGVGPSLEFIGLLYIYLHSFIYIFTQQAAAKIIYLYIYFSCGLNSPRFFPLKSAVINYKFYSLSCC